MRRPLSVALWDHNKKATVLAYVSWLANVVSYIYC